MTTRELVKEIRIKNPCATLQQIANKVDRTRERVRQILNMEQLPTRHIFRSKQHFISCLNCGKPTLNKYFCCRDCSIKYHTILVECTECHKLFYREQRILRKVKNINGIFCSKFCFGRHFGKSNKGKAYSSQHKWDFNLIYQLRQSGKSYKEILELTGCNIRYAQQIVYEVKHNKLTTI